MKIVGKTSWIVTKSVFLRYPTGGSGMISELFFWNPIEKNICCDYVISFWRSLGVGWSEPKSPEIYGRFPGESRKILGNFPEISGKFPDTLRGVDDVWGGCPHPPGCEYIGGCVWAPPWNFRFNFLEMVIMIKLWVYFPPPSIHIDVPLFPTIKSAEPISNQLYTVTVALANQQLTFMLGSVDWG